jgi:hypothetical protein
MPVPIPGVDNMSEPEREFERWLLAVLERGRAQLGTRLTVAPAMEVPQPPTRLNDVSL